MGEKGRAKAMVHPKVKIVEDTIHGVLSPLGFKRQKRTWRKTLPDIMQVVHLDKGTWGPQYHLEFGLHLAKFSDDPRPLFADHVRWGPEQFPGEMLVLQAAALDLEHEMTNGRRIEVMKEVFEKYILPAFNATDTLEKLRSVINGPYDPARPYARALFGFEVEKL